MAVSKCVGEYQLTLIPITFIGALCPSKSQIIYGGCAVTFNTISFLQVSQRSSFAPVVADLLSGWHLFDDD